jgi:EAL domain-containing protein (putative c-di-GMP-specific phosphodiesterase class I)
VEVAERIQLGLRQPLSWDGYPLRLSASIGIAISATGYESAEQILREADAAMYRAKAQGRGRFEIFDAAMRERLRTRQRLEQGLRQALGGDELRLCYQPIVALHDARLLGFEALLRWEHPDGRWLTPPEVLALAEQTGQSPRIEAWTLREACRQAARWREEAGRPLALAVNLSWAQCRRPDLADEVRAVLAEHGLPPAFLWLDVNERCVTDSHAAPALARLREAGVRVFLDDFGAGESPLAPLARATLDAVKLDATVVHGIDHQPDAPLLTAVLSVAGALGLPVVAEGVETAVQRERLGRLGCALGQGLFFAAPLPAEDAAARAAGERTALGAASTEPPDGSGWPFAAPPRPAAPRPSSPAPRPSSPARAKKAAPRARRTRRKTAAARRSK